MCFHKINLQNNVSLPLIGFGTALARGNDCTQAVKHAIKCGYRLIDTAAQYRNEEAVGIAVRECGVPREELFISSKLWNDDHGYDNTLRAFDKTIEWSKLDYLDLYLIHWPNPKRLREAGYEKHLPETWRAMEILYKSGKIRAIGVCNCQPSHLSAIMRTAEIKPMLNQIRLHPGHVQAETVKFCRDNGIAIQAYSPLGAGQLLGNSVLTELARKHSKTPAQVCLRWHLQNGFIPLPKSVTPERIEANLNIFDFELSDKEVLRLCDIPDDLQLLPEPDDADF